jgi:hypothetical protein
MMVVVEAAMIMMMAYCCCCCSTMPWIMATIRMTVKIQNTEKQQQH